MTSRYDPASVVYTSLATVLQLVFYSGVRAPQPTAILVCECRGGCVCQCSRAFWVRCLFALKVFILETVVREVEYTDLSPQV